MAKELTPIEAFLAPLARDRKNVV